MQGTRGEAGVSALWAEWDSPLAQGARLANSGYYLNAGITVPGLLTL